MKLPHRYKPSRWHLILCSCILLCLTVGEWLQPFLCLQDWPHVPTPDKNEVRLLLVADPHIQVYHSPWYPVEFPAITDSDWYLKRYFRHVLNRIRPSVIVFLGDLVEEGSVISPDALRHAFDRFESIFMYPTILVPTFLVPGDNDVGGEWNDPLTEFKMNRFRAHFVSYPRTRRIGFVKFFVDPLNTKWVSPRFSSNRSDLISVYVSHLPMVTPYGMDPSPSLLRSEPSLLINGHDHVECHMMMLRHCLSGMFFTVDEDPENPIIVLHKMGDNDGYVLEWIKNGSNLEHISWLVPPDGLELSRTVFKTDLSSSLRNLDNEPQGRLVQFGVPSCSYRSGQTHLAAYGLARLYRNRTVTYQLFPLPNRLTTLLFYGLVLTGFIFTQLACLKRPRSLIFTCLVLGFCVLCLLAIESFFIFFD